VLVLAGVQLFSSCACCIRMSHTHRHVFISEMPPESVGCVVCCASGLAGVLFVSSYMRIYIYVCMYICIYIYVHIYIYTRIHICSSRGGVYGIHTSFTHTHLVICDMSPGYVCCVVACASGPIGVCPKARCKPSIFICQIHIDTYSCHVSGILLLLVLGLTCS